MENIYHETNIKFTYLLGAKNNYQRSKIKLLFIRDSSQNKNLLENKYLEIKTYSNL